MKLFVISCILVFATAVNAFDKEMMAMKKWTMHKAFEGCFGKEVSKQYLIKVKSAVAKCKGLDAPELDLPMFKSSYRTTSALVNNAFNHKKEDSFEQMMKRYIFEKAFKSMLSDDSEYMDSRRYMRPTMSRFKRESQQELALGLGERLNAKLMEKQMEMQSEIGNYTCVLKECGVLTSDNKFADLDTVLNKFDDMPIGDEWLKSHVMKDVEICHEKASNLPEAMLNECVMGPEFAKVKCYKKCLKYRKLKTCMKFDIKQELEENFAPLDTLLEQTKLSENALLPLVQKLLHGDLM